MPELPEVEAIVRRLRPEVTGAAIARVEVLRARTVLPQKPATVAAAAGKKIEAVERRGKNIVVRLSSEAALRIHLRMTGILRVIPDARLYTDSVRVLFALKGRTRRRLRGSPYPRYRPFSSSGRNRRETRQAGSRTAYTRVYDEVSDRSRPALKTAGEDLSDGPENHRWIGEYLCSRIAICRSNSSGEAGEPGTRTEADEIFTRAFRRSYESQYGMR